MYHYSKITYRLRLVEQSAYTAVILQFVFQAKYIFSRLLIKLRSSSFCINIFLFPHWQNTQESNQDGHLQYKDRYDFMNQYQTWVYVMGEM